MPVPPFHYLLSTYDNHMVMEALKLKRLYRGRDSMFLSAFVIWRGHRSQDEVSASRLRQRGRPKGVMLF